LEDAMGPGMEDAIGPESHFFGIFKNTIQTREERKKRKRKFGQFFGYPAE
jgi:hypothetical protein